MRKHGAVDVSEIADADAHVVNDGRGNGDGNADAEDGVGDGEWPKVAITDKEEARREAEDQGDEGENGIGQMGDGEQHGG